MRNNRELDLKKVFDTEYFSNYYENYRDNVSDFFDSEKFSSKNF